MIGKANTDASTAPESGIERPKDQVTSRNMLFKLDNCDMSSWHASGSHVTAFFNALSVFFPKGEKFFINSVRHHRDRVTCERTRIDMAGFMQQEATHSREHHKYIGAMKACGYEVDQLDVRLFSTALESISPARRLATTIAMEHFTAALAHEVLSVPSVMHGSPEICALWRWHAVEEIEHKAVAFDVFLSAYGNTSASYVVRCSAALEATWNFMSRLAVNMCSLLRKDGKLFDLVEWLKLAHFLWVWPGVFRRMTPRFFAYFSPSFHPSSTRDHYLIDAWRSSATAGNGR